jgi:hypothetical protein
MRISSWDHPAAVTKPVINKNDGPTDTQPDYRKTFSITLHEEEDDKLEETAAVGQRSVVYIP